MSLPKRNFREISIFVSPFLRLRFSSLRWRPTFTWFGSLNFFLFDPISFFLLPKGHVIVIICETVSFSFLLETRLMTSCFFTPLTKNFGIGQPIFSPLFPTPFFTIVSGVRRRTQKGFLGCVVVRVRIVYLIMLWNFFCLWFVSNFFLDFIFFTFNLNPFLLRYVFIRFLPFLLDSIRSGNDHCNCAVPFLETDSTLIGGLGSLLSFVRLKIVSLCDIANK